MIQPCPDIRCGGPEFCMQCKYGPEGEPLDAFLARKIAESDALARGGR